METEKLHPSICAIKEEFDKLIDALKKIRSLDYTRAATNMASYKAHKIACEALGLDEIRAYDKFTQIPDDENSPRNRRS